MDPTDKPRPRVPAPQETSGSLRLSRVTPRNSPASPATPARTPPPPNDRFLGWDAGPDPTIAICEYDVTGDWELRGDLAELSLGGSSQCTISIPGRGLSARHCLLERRARKLRLNDLASSYGVFFRGRRLEGFADLSPGDMFTARPMTFVCLNDEMRQHRPTVFEILGSGAVRTPDWVMVESVTGSGPMLLTGKAGCDLDRLAHAIHAMSTRRNRKAVEVATVPPDGDAQVALAEQAFQTSLILHLGQEEEAPLDPDFVSKLFDARGGIRLIALAASPDIARRALTDANVELMQHIPVRALAYRRGEIHQLLDLRFKERAFHRRADDVTPVNQEALKRYHWPGNFAELRQVADAIIAYATLGSMRRAAVSLGVSRQKLTRHLERIGLATPLFGQDK